MNTQHPYPKGISHRQGLPDDLALLGSIDDDAGMLFEAAGLFLDLPPDHEFHVTERGRWSRSLADGSTTIATDSQGQAVGFVALDQVDGDPFVAQLSVIRSHFRRGIGSALLRSAIDGASQGRTLWLTTYAHLPWNRPFYEMHGFTAVEERSCGGDLREQLRFERRWLPLPEQRIAMRRALGGAVTAR